MSVELVPSILVRRYLTYHTLVLQHPRNLLHIGGNIAPVPRILVIGCVSWYLGVLNFLNIFRVWPYAIDPYYMSYKGKFLLEPLTFARLQLKISLPNLLKYRSHVFDMLFFRP